MGLTSVQEAETRLEKALVKKKVFFFQLFVLNKSHQARVFRKPETATENIQAEENT